MEKRLQYIKISRFVEIFFGVLIGGWLGFFVGIMATDSPNSSELNFVYGALFGFGFTAIPLILLPYLSIRELNKYRKKQKVTFNYITSIIMLIFMLSPLAIWQLFMLRKLKTSE